MNIKRNTLWNVVEVVASTAVIFLLYKIIVARLGVGSLGLWSLVLAATSIGRFADIGVAGGLGRYIAGLKASGAAPVEVRGYIDTALILNTGLYCVLALALYWPAWAALGLTLEGRLLSDARALLPYAICAFALQNIAGVAVAALTGFHRSYQKSLVMLGTLAVQAAVSLILIGPLGLKGVALGQIAQYVLMAVAVWLLVLRQMEPGWRAVLPRRFHRAALHDLVSFGVRLQVLNVANFTFDPIVKFVFTAVGGVTALGLYELVQRGLLQVRQVLLAPTQNLTPLLAAADRAGDGSVGVIYERALALLMMAALPAMALMALGSPILSLIWLGRVDQDFIVYSFIAAAGWALNILSAPAWNLGVATGYLRWNIGGALAGSVGALVLCFLLGRAAGALGVVAGAMIAIGGGGLLSWVMNAGHQGLPVLPGIETWRLVIARLRSGGLRFLRGQAPG